MCVWLCVCVCVLYKAVDDQDGSVYFNDFWRVCVERVCVCVCVCVCVSFIRLTKITTVTWLLTTFRG